MWALMCTGSPIRLLARVSRQAMIPNLVVGRETGWVGAIHITEINLGAIDGIIGLDKCGERGGKLPSPSGHSTLKRRENSTCRRFTESQQSVFLGPVIMPGLRPSI